MKIRIRITSNQWGRLAEILGNLGLVFFASVVLPYILDKSQTLMIILGLMLTFASWFGSMVAERKVK